HLERGILAEHIQERQVAVLVGLLDHTVKVSNRLMVVKHQSETKRLRHSWFTKRAMSRSTLGRCGLWWFRRQTQRTLPGDFIRHSFRCGYSRSWDFDLGFSQKSGRFFGRHGINVKTGTPLKPGRLR